MKTGLTKEKLYDCSVSPPGFEVYGSNDSLTKGVQIKRVIMDINAWVHYSSTGCFVMYGRAVFPSLIPHHLRTFPSRKRPNWFFQVGSFPPYGNFCCAFMIHNFFASANSTGVSDVWFPDHTREVFLKIFTPCSENECYYIEWSVVLYFPQSITFPNDWFPSTTIWLWTGWAGFVHISAKHSSGMLFGFVSSGNVCSQTGPLSHSLLRDR